MAGFRVGLPLTPEFIKDGPILLGKGSAAQIRGLGLNISELRDDFCLEGWNIPQSQRQLMKAKSMDEIKSMDLQIQGRL